MKTRSLILRVSLLTSVGLMAANSLPAEDIRIRIPNPVKHIEKRLNQVGNFIARTARRVEIVVEDERPLPPPPPVTRTTVVTRVEPRDGTTRYLEEPAVLPPTPPPVPPPSLTARVPLSSSGVRVPPPAVAPSPAPAQPSGPVVAPPPITSRKTSPQERASETVTQGPSTETVVHAPTSAAPQTQAKPTPPPKHEYGKPVPGRPGMVHPPGVKAAPENMVDVRDISPGTKVRDPGTGIVFLVP